jgi:hypothetical protein
VLPLQAVSHVTALARTNVGALAMQEVVGSSPIIRLRPQETGGFPSLLRGTGASDLLLASDGLGRVLRPGFSSSIRARTATQCIRAERRARLRAGEPEHPVERFADAPDLIVRGR